MSLAVFLVAFSAVLYLALNGGSFDIVVRQEVAVAVWWVLALGIVAGVLPRARVSPSALVALGLLALFALWTFLGLSWSSSDERTLAEGVRVLLFVGAVGLALALVDRSIWRPAVAGLAAGAVAVCAIGVGSRLFPHVFPTDVVAEAFNSERLSYPLDYWNAMATWGAMSLALALASSGHAAHALVRAIALAAVPICGLTVYLAYSRAGVADIAVAVAMVLALSGNRWLTLLHALVAGAGTALVIAVVRGEDAIAEGTSGSGAGTVMLAIGVAALVCVLTVLATTRFRAERLRLGPRSARAALGAGALVVLLGIVLVAPRLDDVWDDFRTTNAEAGPEINADPAARLGDLHGNRYLIWRSALDAFGREPLHGIGAGTFEFSWSRVGDGFLLDAHSLYLETLAELGVVGLAILLLALILFGVAAVLVRATVADRQGRGLQAGLIAAFAAFLLHAGVDWIWESTAVAALALLAIAIAGAAGAEVRETPPRARWRVAGALGGIAAILVALPGLASVTLVRDSQAALRSGDQQEAERLAGDAVEAEPWAASPYVQRGLVAEAGGELREARRDLELAVEREAENWRHRLLLSRIEAQLGNVRPALSEFRAARRLHPASQFFAAPPP